MWGDWCGGNQKYVVWLMKVRYSPETKEDFDRHDEYLVLITRVFCSSKTCKFYLTEIQIDTSDFQ